MLTWRLELLSFLEKSPVLGKLCILLAGTSFQPLSSVTSTAVIRACIKVADHAVICVCVVVAVMVFSLLRKA